MIPRFIRLSRGFGAVREVRGADGSHVRVLQVGGVYQSATYTDERRMEPVFAYYCAFDLVFELHPEARRLLMVGGGGYAWPKHVLATRPPEVALDVVELEPAVTRAARRWFFLDEALERWPGRLRLIEGDGRAYLDEYACKAGETSPLGKADETSALGEEGEPYDAIVLDAFRGSDPVAALAGSDAARAARAALAPGGVLLANVVSADAGEDVSYLQQLMAAYREAFAHVYAVLCESDPLAVEDNYLLVATDGSARPEGAVAEL